MNSHMLWWTWLSLFTVVYGQKTATKAQVQKAAATLGEQLREVADRATEAQEIVRVYKMKAVSEKIDPEAELDRMVGWMEKYLETRANDTWKAKISLEAQPLDNITQAEEFNKVTSPTRFQYIDAKSGDDGFVMKPFDADVISVNATNYLEYTPNANFYNMSVNTANSAVHVPTPIYNREPDLLRKVKWSNIDKVYIGKKQDTRDISWQFFCSESGFLRFYPASKWIMDDPDNDLDLYDCRSSEWYIDGATNAKNIIILLDMSGSMLGQKFEIAKQTIETIMETLSENDFFNIMTFSKEPAYLGSCFNGSLVQATLRNKKRARLLLETVAKSGIADYAPALVESFQILYKLTLRPNWTSAEHARKHGAPSCEGYEKCMRTFAGDWIKMTHEYLWAVKNASTTDTVVGCNSAIMLVTDGASDTHEAVFKEWNSEKKVRFFSFLIGAEATEFREVRWMACFNWGFMVHIANLADVQEKVQHYIKVMSRPVGFNSSLVTPETPVWTGVYMERLFSYPADGGFDQFLRLKGQDPESLKMVTTVAYPVVYNGTFMGVAGVAVPMIELQQMAPTFLLGANTYTFLVDNNGYVMFHWQLRPLSDPHSAISRALKHTYASASVTSDKLEAIFSYLYSHQGTIKPNYNSMDVLELEVPSDNSLVQLGKIASFAPIRTDDKAFGQMARKKLDIEYFWSLIEPQFYPTESDPDAPERKRLSKNDTDSVLQPLDYDLQLRRYMVDGNSSKTVPTVTADVLVALEELRRVYKQSNTYYFRGIKGTLFSVGLAVPREGVFRLKRKNPFYYSQIERSWLEDTKHFRLHPNWRYCLLNDSDFNKTPEMAIKTYIELAKETNELPYLCVNYSRADLVNRLLLDAETSTFLTSLWKNRAAEDDQSGIHLVFFAMQSGLTRFWDQLVKNVEYRDPTFVPADANETDLPPPEEKPPYSHFVKTHLRASEESFYQRSTRLKDKYVFDFNQNTRVFYSNPQKSVYGHNENVSLLVTATKALFVDEAPVGVVGIEMLYDELAKMVNQNTHWCSTKDQEGNDNSKEDARCYLLDEHGFVVYSSNDVKYDVLYSPLRAKMELGKFYGSLSNTEAEIFRLLIKNEIYKTVTYVDYQGFCDSKNDDSAATRLLSPIFNLLKLLVWAFRELSTLIAEYSFWNLVATLLTPAEAYTNLFQPDAQKGYSCDKAKDFYILDWENKPQLSLATRGRSCQGCAVEIVASMVPNTNLLLLVQYARDEGQQDAPVNGENGDKKNYCYADKCSKSTMPEFMGFIEVNNASDKNPTLEEDATCKSTRPRYRRAPAKCWTSDQDESHLPCSGAVYLWLSPLVFIALLAVSLS